MYDIMYGDELHLVSDTALRDRLTNYMRSLAKGGDEAVRAEKMSPPGLAIYFEMSRRSMAGLLGEPDTIKITDLNKKMEALLKENNYEWPQWSRAYLNQETVVAKNARVLIDLWRASTREERIKYGTGIDPGLLIAYQGMRRRCGLPPEDPREQNKEEKQKNDKELSRCKTEFLIEVYRRVLQ